jgi:hypothetical protein
MEQREIIVNDWIHVLKSYHFNKVDTYMKHPDILWNYQSEKKQINTSCQIGKIVIRYLKYSTGIFNPTEHEKLSISLEDGLGSLLIFDNTNSFLEGDKYYLLKGNWEPAVFEAFELLKTQIEKRKKQIEQLESERVARNLEKLELRPTVQIPTLISHFKDFFKGDK